MAKVATKSAKSNEAEVSRFIHDAVLKLAESDTGRMKLLSKKGESDGLFPAGTTAALKEATKRAIGENGVLRVAGKEGKTEVVELTPEGVAAIGIAVQQTADTLPAAEGIRLAERLMAKRPDTVVELEPLVAKLSERQRREAERETKQRHADAERQQQVREAMRRWEAGLEQRRQARIAALKGELAELGGGSTTDSGTPRPDTADPAEFIRLNDEIARLKGELRAAKAAASDQSVIAPADSQEFVRNVARRLVGVWAEAVEKGNDNARNAIEVAICNVGAIESIGEEGDTVPFDPQRHQSGGPIDPDKAVVVERPGWVLAEQAGVEYVIQKARVGQGG